MKSWCKQTSAVFFWLLLSGLPAWSAATTSIAPVATVPLKVARGQLMIEARLNGRGPYSFLLDTGYAMTMVRRDLAESLQLERSGEITVEGIAGEERAPTYRGAELEFGSPQEPEGSSAVVEPHAGARPARYTPGRVGAMPATRRRRDGIVGAGLFRQYVVIVDIPGKTLTLRSPTNFTYAGHGEIVPLQFRRSTPIVEATIVMTNSEVAHGLFEIDTGCDSGICLSHDFTVQHNLSAATNTQEGGKYGVGGGVRTLSGRVPELQIGALKIERPETDFFVEGSPVDRGLAGHIGMEVLKQFRIYFDYAHRRMILERLVP